jgi:dihydroorotate dehydrogenase
LPVRTQNTRVARRRADGPRSRAPPAPPPPPKKNTHTKRLALATSVAAGAGAGYYTFVADTARRFEIASALGPPLRLLLDAEAAHRAGIVAARLGLYPRDPRPDPPSLRARAFGLSFPNPIGLAAGFDKDAECPSAMLGLGFGFVEVGSVTPRPQPGNPRPRAFRLERHGAVINRYGFNSGGAEAAAGRLGAFAELRARDPERAARQGGLLAVNLGKNKATPEERAAGDYALGVAALGPFADFIVVNVSSPNTPGLRALQGRKQLERLLRVVKEARDALPMVGGEGGGGEGGGGGGGDGQPPRPQSSARRPPLLVKVAPDLTPADRADVAAAVAAAGVDGIVVGNTTITRPDSIKGHAHAAEAGGLSGKPLLELSTAVLADFYRLTGGEVPLVGCGGVSSGADAYAKIRAGASLVELYTALAYEGPALVPRVKQELAALLERDGFASVAEAVGADHRAGRKGEAGGGGGGAPKGGGGWFKKAS